MSTATETTVAVPTVQWSSGSTKYDNGMRPTVALNGSGQIVEVHAGSGTTKIYSHTGTMSGTSVSLHDSQKFDSGFVPDVALTPGGVAVEVHCSANGVSQLWANAGTINGSSMNWNNANTVGSNDGYWPSVAVNGNGNLVLVWQNGNSLYSLPGQLTGTSIGWGTAQSYDSGYEPSVAVNNLGQIIEVHEAAPTGGALWYHFGQISGNTISWGPALQIPGGNNMSSPAVALNNNGQLIVCFNDGNNLKYVTGVISGATVLWSGVAQYDTGHYPNVALNDAGQVLEVHMALISASYLYYHPGTMS